MLVMLTACCNEYQGYINQRGIMFVRTLFSFPGTAKPLAVVLMLNWQLQYLALFIEYEHCHEFKGFFTLMNKGE